MGGCAQLERHVFERNRARHFVSSEEACTFREGWSVVVCVHHTHAMCVCVFSSLCVNGYSPPALVSDV